MAAYPEVYLDEVVENQGKLFDYVAHSFPDSDTVDFINAGFVYWLIHFYFMKNTD